MNATPKASTGITSRAPTIPASVDHVVLTERRTQIGEEPAAVHTVEHVLAAVAGIVYSSRMNAAQPNAGSGVELDAIAACFIGGASTTGGIGRVGGAMIGGLLMAVISNIMSLLGLPMQLQSVVKGVMLLLAVAFDQWNRRRAEVTA